MMYDDVTSLLILLTTLQIDLLAVPFWKFLSGLGFWLWAALHTAGIGQSEGPTESTGNLVWSSLGDINLVKTLN
jgi:hypothetical protein